MTKIRAKQIEIQEVSDATNTINWNTAYQIGEGLTIVSTGTPSITTLNETDIAFVDSSQDDLRTYRWNGSYWVQIGSDLPIASMNNPAIAALNSTDIAFVDDQTDTLRTYRWNEGTGIWAQLGNSVAISGITFPTLTALNGTDIAYIDATNDSLRTYSFDGTDWALVGNGLTITSVSTPTLTTLNTTDVAYLDGTNDDLRTYRFDGTDWVQVGNDLNIPLVNSPTLTTLNGTDVAMIDGATGQLRTYRFDGTDWVQIGVSLTINGVLLRPGFTALNGTDIAFIDSSQDELRTYRCGATIGTVDVASITEARYSPNLDATGLEGWNLEGASFDHFGTDLSSHNPFGHSKTHFSPDGAHMYTIQWQEDDVIHWTLTTPWDINTAVFADEKLAITEVAAPIDISDLYLDPTGTKMYLQGFTNKTMYQYTLGTAWNVSTAVYDSVSYVFDGYSAPYGIDFSADGSLFFVSDTGTHTLYVHRMLTPWDLNTALFRGDTYYLGLQDGQPTDIAFSADGRTAFMLGDTGGDVTQYTLPDPWNVHTMVYNGIAFKPSSALSLLDVEGLFVKPDGTKMYITDRFERKVYQFDVSGEINVNTATETTHGVLPLATQQQVELGIEADTILTPKSLATWNKLPTSQFANEGWNLSNASFDNIIYDFNKAHLSNQSVYGMHFSEDGLNLYTTEAAVTTPNVYQHILEIPFDIQSISSIQTIGLLESDARRY